MTITEQRHVAIALLIFAALCLAFMLADCRKPRRRPADVEAVEKRYQASGYAPDKTQR
jgi:hypothetical protein